MFVVEEKKREIKKEILTVENLEVSFKTNSGIVHAIRGVSFGLPEGSTLALVGESGSGKTVTMKAIVGLLDDNAIVNEGRIVYRASEEGVDLLRFEKRDLRRRINGRHIAMVFQDPMTSLDPTMTIGEQVAEAVRLHKNVSQAQAQAQAVRLLEQVGLPEPQRRMTYYPHRLSGGQRQRVGIAIALACEPRILICDEPTTALDVTVQDRILDLIRDLQVRPGLSVIYITHDLGVVAKVADFVAVMYAGRIVEKGTVEEIFYDPRHPYTWGLLSAMPDLEADEGRLYSIPGSPPNLLHEPEGDAFAARNEFALKVDERVAPPLFRITPTHYAATWLLAPEAPKVDLPQQLKARLARARKKANICE